MFMQKILTSLVFFFVCHSGFAFIPGADRYEIHFGTDFPIQVGLKGRVNLNTHTYSAAEAGFAISPYLNSYKTLAQNLGIQSHFLDALTTAWTNSLILRLALGFTKSIYEGPYMDLGYTLMLYGKGSVSGKNFNHLIPKEQSSEFYQIPTIHHGPSVYIGYRFILIDKLSINSHFGVYKPLFLHSGKSNGSLLKTSLIQSLRSFVVRRLWMPCFGLWIGLSF